MRYTPSWTLLTISIINIISATEGNVKEITNNNIDTLVTELSVNNITDIQVFAFDANDLTYRNQVSTYDTTANYEHLGDIVLSKQIVGQVNSLKTNRTIDSNSKLRLITISSKKGLFSTSKSQILYYCNRSSEKPIRGFLTKIYPTITNSNIKSKIATINDDYVRNPIKLSQTVKN